MKANFTLHNEFDIISHNIVTGEKKTAKAYNVITNNGLLKARTREPFGNYTHIGTGSGTPSATDTSLFAGTVAKANSLDGISWDEATKTMAVRFVISFNETEQNGSKFTEVGLAYSTTTSSLSTHAMIVDEHGAPMTVEKTDTIILTVYATLYIKLTLPESMLFFDAQEFCAGMLRHLTRSSKYHPLAGVQYLGPYRGSQYSKNSRFVPYPNFQKGFTFTNTDTGYKCSIDILGSEANGTLIRSIGISDSTSTSSDTYSGKAQLMQNIKDLIGYNTELKDKVVGTGDGVTQYFPVVTDYPILSTDKFKVKVNGIDTVATPCTYKSFDSMQCGQQNYGDKMIYYYNGKYYITTDKYVTNGTRTLRLYVSDTPEFTEDNFVGETPTFELTVYLYEQACAIIPTYIPNKVLVVKYVTRSGLTKDNGVYMGTINEDKTISLSPILVTFSGYPSISINNDYKFFTLNGIIYYITANAEITQVGSANAILDDLAIEYSTFKIYKLSDSTGSPVATHIGTYERSNTHNVGQFKRIPGTNKYAVASIGTQSGDKFLASGNVCIIDADTSVVTNEVFKVINPDSYVYNTNASTSVYTLTFKMSTPSYDYCLDLVNKTIFIHPVNQAVIGNYFNPFNMLKLGGNKYLASNTTQWVILEEGPEYISGFTLAAPPESGSKITINGEYNGFLKTSDSKISYEVEVTYNA